MADKDAAADTIPKVKVVRKKSTCTTICIDGTQYTIGERHDVGLKGSNLCFRVLPLRCTENEDRLGIS